MKREYVPHLLDEDPHKILGATQDSGEEEIRLAYLKKIKAYPPDRAPEEFERIRDAYEILSDPRHRARAQLFSVDPEISLVALLDNQEAKRAFVGPGPWLAAMEK